MKTQERHTRIKQPLLVALVLVLIGLLLLLSYTPETQLSAPYWIVVGVCLVLLYLFIRQSQALLKEAQRITQKKSELEESLAREKALREELALLAQEEDETAETTDQTAVLKGFVERLQGGSVQTLGDAYFHLLSEQWQLVQGMLFLPADDGEYTLQASYAYFSEDTTRKSFRLGETLTGQTLKEGKPLFLDQIPEDYVIISSGLGRSAPKNLLIIPLTGEDRVTPLGAVELAFFHALKPEEQGQIEQLSAALARKLELITEEESAE